MGGGGSGKRNSTTPVAPQPMYFLEGGLLVVGKLLKPDAWVHDEVRTHCNVCVQQFLPFRRRHHCRTCGEVVCGGCSSKREIRQTDVNVHCATRVCTFCMIRATDASIKVHETAVRETLAMDKRRMSIQPPACTGSSSATIACNAGESYASYSGASSARSESDPQPPAGIRRRQQLSMWSMESDLTTGSVVQLWPQPIPDDESARLRIARNSVILRSDNDPTMNLLVSIIARTLECPVAFIGILDDSFLWFKASVGWDRTHIPRDDCVCSHTLAQSKTMIVPDTNLDKHFHANNISINARPLRYYAGAPIRVLGRCIGVVCALDTSPHKETSAAMRSTLEAIANIVSEVLEQRVDGGSSVPRATNSTFMSSVRTMPSVHEEAPLHHHHHHQQQQQQHQHHQHHHLQQHEHSMASETASDSGSERSSSIGTGSGEPLDLNASLQGLNLEEYASSQSSSDEVEWADPSPCMYLALSSVPPEYGEKIGVSMDFFQRLQSTLWCERSSQDGVKAFELFRDGRQFTRSNTKLSGKCSEVVAHLQNYENIAIYQNLFSRVVRRYNLSSQTWMDEMTFKPNGIVVGNTSLRVLTHSRQYPDGSTVVVAMDATKLYEASEHDLLFGWFVAPCSLHDGLGSVNVSCIVTQPVENQVAHDPNLSCDLLLRLRRCLPQQQQQQQLKSSYRVSPATAGLPPVVTAGQARPARTRSSHSATSESSNQRLSHHPLVRTPTPVPAASLPAPRDYRVMHTGSGAATSFGDNQRSNEAKASGLGVSRSISEESIASFSSNSTNTSRSACAKIVPMHYQQQQYEQSPTLTTTIQQRQVSNLNANERMMLDLLDKTISTQEILAAQQHEMANVIDYHGSQLLRISSAIERVENMLADSGERLKRLPLPKDHRSMN